jgi:hypothetical protein
MNIQWSDIYTALPTGFTADDEPDIPYLKRNWLRSQKLLFVKPFGFPIIY